MKFQHHVQGAPKEEQPVVVEWRAYVIDGTVFLQCKRPASEHWICVVMLSPNKDGNLVLERTVMPTAPATGCGLSLSVSCHISQSK